MNSVCFTGHREIKNERKLSRKLKRVLKELIKDGVTDFYAGGAIGWDMLCEQAVLKLRDKKYPDIKLHLILPCCEEEQTLKWNSEQKTMYHKILCEADSVEFVSQHYYNGCMKKRNQRLVDFADCCICYYDKTKSASGTGQTVRMAEKKGINIINIHK